VDLPSRLHTIPMRVSTPFTFSLTYWLLLFSRIPFFYYWNAAKHLAKLIPFIGNLQHIKCLLSRVVCISSCHPGESGLRWKKCRNIKRHALHAKEKQSVQILWISPTSRVSLSFLHVGSVLEPLASSMRSERNQSARRGVRLTIVPKVVSTMAGMAMTPH